ncbi:MAG TPA: hypothetical protein VKB80_04015 [Kofleriaceae bacterium]|nr:hypothetical protein [Kofleriaceae bacterium]
MNTTYRSTNPIDGGAAGSTAAQDRPGGLLAWQWASYSLAHTDRRNLLIHALTVPLFIAGSALVATTPLVGWLGLAGLASMLAAVALQGSSHRGEPHAPAPFRGKLDLAARLFAEQWVTFPRFVLTGGFARAWYASRRA